MILINFIYFTVDKHCGGLNNYYFVCLADGTSTTTMVTVNIKETWPWTQHPGLFNTIKYHHKQKVIMLHAVLDKKIRELHPYQGNLFIPGENPM